VKRLMSFAKALVIRGATLPSGLKESILSASGTLSSLETYFFLRLFRLLSIALYGLLVFYGLMHEELKGRRPMAKFLSIKLIVMFTFYQSFVVSTLHSPLGFPFHPFATPDWRSSNKDLEG
jgi:hypothetical protein